MWSGAESPGKSASGHSGDRSYASSVGWKSARAGNRRRCGAIDSSPVAERGVFVLSPTVAGTITGAHGAAVEVPHRELENLRQPEGREQRAVK